MTAAIRFLNLLLAALLTGIIFGIWIGTDPRSLSMSAYVEQQQNAIRALNTLMPILGGLTILITLTGAILQRKNKPVFIALLTAAGLFIITGLITRLGNQPINATVMSWNSKSIPSDWTELRDKWWQYHQLRTAACFAALVIVIWAGLRKDRQPC